MTWLDWHTLEIGDARIVDAERVRALGDTERLEDAMVQEREEERDRLADRLRAYRKAIRRRGFVAGRSDALKEVAQAFASDCKRWAAVEERLRDAVERALHELAPAFPTALFVDAAIARLVAARDDSVPWVIYVNLDRFPDADRFRVDGDGVSRAPVRVMHASYLADGVCVVETPDGVVELRGDIERELILGTIRDAVLGDREGRSA